MARCCDGCAGLKRPANHACPASPAGVHRPTVVLAGNPNSGKTTVFNALTGLRQKIGNYGGVTVERKLGACRLPDGTWWNVIDLPGSYSLVPRSPDERVAMEVLCGLRPDTPAPDAVIAVVDASNLQRNLYFVSQLIEQGLPLVIALNMMDIAERRGVTIDAAALERLLGVPVVPMVCHRRHGVAQLVRAVGDARVATVPDWPAPEGVGIDRVRAEIEARYRWVEEVAHGCASGHRARVDEPARILPELAPHLSERIDRIALHPGWGLLIFALVMGSMFASIFCLARPLQAGLVALLDAMGAAASAPLPTEALRSLVRDGVFAGVGSVLAFVPQIAILFLFLAVLEDSGYLARAAFLMDRLLSRVGLHGKSFIPLLSGFACAIPAIMAARTIEGRRGRLATILVIPFMTCSARLPVYALLVGTFFAAQVALTQAAVMLALYVLGIVCAAGAAFLFRRTLLKGREDGFILELPTYKVPQLSLVARQAWVNSSKFVTRAGSTIFIICLALWAISYYPRLPAPEAAQWTDAGAKTSAQQAYSVAGRLGHAIEPAIRPLGFDWKMGVGCIGAFAAREVFVSTLAIVYGTSGEAAGANLGAAMRADRYPDGRPVWTPLVAANLLLWFVMAMQCLSTVMVVRQEAGWKWALFVLVYMNVLAYVSCLFVYQIGHRVLAG